MVIVQAYGSEGSTTPIPVPPALGGLMVRTFQSQKGRNLFEDIVYKAFFKNLSY